MTHRRLVKLSVAYWVAVATFMAMFAVRSASAQGPPAAAVRVDPVRMERVQERRMITGDIRAVRRSRIAAQEPGIVVEMPVREGEIIEKNTLLAQLDSSRLSIELRQLEANQQVLKSALRERQLLLQLERNDAESMRAAYERQGANAKEMRDADTAVSVAQARLAQAEHQIDVLKARIDLLTKRVADMGIRAPFSGLVVAKHTDIGEWVGEGDAVVELVSVDAVEVWLDVPQQYFDWVRGDNYSVAIEIESTGRAYQSST
ncbi:MAG: efflux RND transporter periplasmic adaptor subunit, partial [Pseudomonadales bacterium]